MDKYRDQQNAIKDEKVLELKKDFPDFVCEFIDSIKLSKKSTNTQYSYAYDLKVFFTYISDTFSISSKDITPKFLDNLTPRDIQHYLAFLIRYRTIEDAVFNKRHPEKPRKYHTNSSAGLARKLAALRGLYRYLRTNSLAENNPAALVFTPKNEKDGDDIIALDNFEVERMLRGAEDGSSLSGKAVKFSKYTRLRDMAILKLLIGTGLRVSELVGIDLTDIDWETRSINVFRKESKKQRVYMPEETADAVYNYIHKERIAISKNETALFVSPRKGTRLTVRSIERIVKKYTENTTNQDIHVHSLRATYATNLYKNTNDIKLVADALGHKDLATVSRYSRTGETNRKRAANLVNYEKEED